MASTSKRAPSQGATISSAATNLPAGITQMHCIRRHASVRSVAALQRTNSRAQRAKSAHIMFVPGSSISFKLLAVTERPASCLQGADKGIRGDLRTLIPQAQNCTQANSKQLTAAARNRTGQSMSLESNHALFHKRLCHALAVHMAPA